MFDDRYKGLTLDDAAAKAGGYVASHPDKKFILDYDYHAISNYCREKGIKRESLTEMELKQFEFDPPQVYPRTKA
jgi:hypothetical protein